MDWETRFLSKVRRSADCWEWLGSHDRDGYGRFWRYGECRAHRISYEVFVGRIPDGLTIDHLCENPGCVNPAHLEPVLIGVNLLRSDTPAARNARKTHCPKGHEYTPGNTHRRANGKRECRECMRLRRRAQLARQRLASTD